MRYTLFSVVAFTSLTSARPLLGLDIGSFLSSLKPASDDDSRWTDFQHPGVGDARSPCPGLNALANHSFLHRDERNLTLSHIMQGLAQGLHMGPDLSLGLAAAAMIKMNKKSFNLDDLDIHNNPIEHDASISRQDHYFGSAVDLNQDARDQYISFFDGKEKTDLGTVAQAHFARFNDSLTRNPEFFYGQRQTVLNLGENVLYTQVLARPSSENAKLDYVKSLFIEKKLPYELGWRVSSDQINVSSMGKILLKLQALVPKPIKAFPVYVISSFKDELISMIGGLKSLADITEGLSSQVGF